MKEKENSDELRKDIISIIKNINIAWTKGKIEDLKKYLYKDIVIVSPDFKNRLKGIDDVLDSYKEFYENSKIYDFSEFNFNVEIFDKTATADYEYHIIYEINNNKYDGTGTEIWTFGNIHSKWFALRRCMANVIDKEIK
ncbi:MAG: hypothetical protein P8Z35_09615 [Ignavibacteriaceae bacterium]